MADFEQSYNYGATNYAQMTTYYLLLEKLFNLLMFQARTSGNLVDVLELEHAVENGVAFWNADL